MEVQTESPEVVKQPKPVRKRRKRRARARVARQPKVAGPPPTSIFAGLGEGKTRCADACTRERCVITEQPRCGWPSLQAEDSRNSMTVVRYKEAKLYHAHKVADKKAKR